MRPDRGQCNAPGLPVSACEANALDKRCSENAHSSELANLRARGKGSSMRYGCNDLQPFHSADCASTRMLSVCASEELGGENRNA